MHFRRESLETAIAVEEHWPREEEGLSGNFCML
jgi:hypothetical protein